MLVMSTHMHRHRRGVVATSVKEVTIARSFNMMADCLLCLRSYHSNGRLGTLLRVFSNAGKQSFTN